MGAYSRRCCLTDMFGSVLLPPFCFPHSWWLKKTWSNMEPAPTNYESAAYEALLVPSKITSRSAAHLKCRSHTPADFCMLCLVHKEICICIFTSSSAFYITTVICLAALFVLVTDLLWGKPSETSEFRCTVIAVPTVFLLFWCLIVTFYCNSFFSFNKNIWDERPFKKKKSWRYFLKTTRSLLIDVF